LAFGTVMAFLAQLSSIGKGMQKVGVQTLPELSANPAVLWQYLSSKKWRNGMLLDILGAVFGFVSLTILPISVAQPIFCNGLVLLACYSHFYLREQLARREWRAIGLCFVGTLLLAVTLVPRDWDRTHIGWLQVKLSVVLALVLPLLCAFEMGIRRAKRARGVPNRSAIELLTGLQAGLCIGVGNASLASGLQSTSRSWLDHVAKEHVGSDAWPDTSLSSGVWLHLVCAGCFVILGAALNAMHPVFANRGYQHGRVVLISTHTALVSMVAGVLVGIYVLDEAWPGRPMMSAMRYLAFLCMIYGVVSMNWSSIKGIAARFKDKDQEGEGDGVVEDGTALASPGTRERRSSSESPGLHPAARKV
jgi:multidrug transporter EmrE-like cation transporter